MAHNTDVDEATLVHIAVRKEQGVWVVRVFPSRPGDTIAFYSKNPGQKSAERPHKVVWVSHDLVNNMKLTISAKGASSLFKGFDLTPGANEVHVDSPTGIGTWQYKIDFFADSTAGTDPDYTVDPDVIVHNDP